MNIDPKYKAWFSVLLTTAVGGFVSYLTAALATGVPPQDQWKSILVGAAIAALAAVAHLIQTPPRIASLAYKAALRSRGFVQLRVLVSLALVACLAFALVACSWWKGGGEAKVADAGDCIAQHALAGDNVEQIGAACFLPVAKVIESLVTTADAKVAATPAARESRAARASMAAVDGGS